MLKVEFRSEINPKINFVCPFCKKPDYFFINTMSTCMDCGRKLPRLHLLLEDAEERAEWHLKSETLC